jgi:3-methylcrotonyl-CoA carboxylase alpha subunit
MFQKILVANRGEIARRIFRACRELAVGAVAVYSEVDGEAGWVREADESYPLPGFTAVETYLNQNAILDIATAVGAEAIHPGYGFLSENAAFAQACADRGIVFIGPTPAAMAAMGSKAGARALATKAGVPVIPGVDGAGLSLAELEAAAQDIGYPVLIKASAGGGGKGMRVVTSSADFKDAAQAARNESKSSFGSDHILLEKYFTEIHHVEVQVLGDQHGRVIHLFERECSIQRRHQKIIEETPSPNVTAELRQAMTAAAVALAQAVNYVSAGTVEFVVDGNGRYYLLEMNTRLQVEHPITELVTGLDLATWQIRIAAGEPLTIRQEDLQQRGHAIECRLYAEDPANNFMPAIGPIAVYQAPAGPGVRVDDGIESGGQVTPYYDPMLAKVITWGADRSEALAKMTRALRQTVLLGVTTNIPYLLAILDDPEFQAGRTTTDFLNQRFAAWRPDSGGDDTDWLALAAFEALKGDSKKSATGAVANGSSTAEPDPWNMANSWRNGVG